MRKTNIAPIRIVILISFLGLMLVQCTDRKEKPKPRVDPSKAAISHLDEMKDSFIVVIRNSLTDQEVSKNTTDAALNKYLEYRWASFRRQMLPIAQSGIKLPPVADIKASTIDHKVCKDLLSVPIKPSKYKLADFDGEQRVWSKYKNRKFYIESPSVTYSVGDTVGIRYLMIHEERDIVTTKPFLTQDLLLISGPEYYNGGFFGSGGMVSIKAWDYSFF